MFYEEKQGSPVNSSFQNVLHLGMAALKKIHRGSLCQCCWLFDADVRQESNMSIV